MKQKNIVSLFLVILIFSEFIGFRLWAAEEIGGSRITGVYALLAFAISLILGILLAPPVMRIISYFKSSKQPATRIYSSKRSFVILWALLFACYIPCFLAFYPGIYNNDMVWQWAMYTMKNYSSHHPILHTYLTGSLFETGKNIFGSYNAGLAIHSIFQLLILSGSIAFALNYLLKTGISKKIFMVFFLFYAIYPYIPVMGLSTTKDTLFSSFFLIIFVCLSEMFSKKMIYSGWKLAAFFVVFILCGMLRNNAVYGFVLMIVYLFIWVVILMLRHKSCSFQKKLLFLLGAGILTTHLCLAALFGIVHAEKGKINEMLSVPCQQMARAYLYNESELSENDKQILFAFIPEEDLQNYVYYISDPVKNALNGEAVSAMPAEFLKLWVKIGMKSPREYMEAFLTNTFGVWYLTGDSGSNLPYEYLPFYDDEHVFTEESKLPGLKSVYKWFQYENYEKYLPFVSMIFYTPFFNWMTILSSFILVAKRRFYLLFLPAFLLSYSITVLLGPCVAVRYLFNIILCAPFLFALTINFKSESTTKS